MRTIPDNLSGVDPVSRRVGRRIRRIRHERGLSLAALGGEDLTRGFLSAVETGRSSISLKALSLVASRLGVPMSYFVDDRPMLTGTALPTVDLATAALAYSLYLRDVGNTDEALAYALWAAQSFVVTGSRGKKDGTPFKGVRKER